LTDFVNDNGVLLPIVNKVVNATNVDFIGFVNVVNVVAVKFLYKYEKNNKYKYI